jgi:hypothetical protein
MPLKKTKSTPVSDANDDVIRKVDAMMDVEAKAVPSKPATPRPATPKSDPTPQKLVTTPVSAPPKPITTPVAASAPVLPPALLKKINVHDASDAPVHMTTKSTPTVPEKGTPAAAQPIAIPGLPDASVEESAEPAASQSEPDVLSGAETDKAVEDIVAHEGDTLLALEDARNSKKQAVAAPKRNWKASLGRFLRSKKVLLLLPLALLIVLALPWTRYPVLGMVLKKNVPITVVDSKTSSPVSGARVQVSGSSSVVTDENGKAVVRAGVGNRTITIEKQYYTPQSTSYFVGMSGGQPKKVSVTATGRLVPVTVRNKVTGKPVAGAVVAVLKTTAKTNAKGLASIALPANAATYKANVSLAGYNRAEITVQVTDTAVKANEFTLTPAGHVYFLSNANGTIDVVRSNLDGSDRKTILEGTGKETGQTTSLLASRDWRYVVLKARRDTAQPALYLIDTKTDQVSDFDTSNSELTLIGWYNHTFVYKQARKDRSPWQTGSQIIKAYDADNTQLNQLDQTQAEGDASSYVYQDFQNFYLQDNAVIYTTQWYTYSLGESPSLDGKTATIRTVQPNGQNKKDQHSEAAASVGWIEAALYKPQEVYFGIRGTTGFKSTYYEYENQAVKSVSGDQVDFNKAYPTFLLSPTGSRTFWSELRDGKNTLFTGDKDAENKKQLATQSEYAPYGWFGDAYLLVTKNNSELYIMPAAALSGSQQPVKVTDYYKPAQTYPGYGYGYGGL